MYYSVFLTGYGYGAAVSDGNSIIKTYLPEEANNTVVNRVFQEFPGIEEKESEILKETGNLLSSYFKGENPDFSGIPVSALKTGGFDRKVLEITNTIPYGEVRTYKWISGQLNDPKKARAVGNALGRNPVPVIVPCHRIIKSDGELGGFSSGLEWKIKLLKLEKIIK